MTAKRVLISIDEHLLDRIDQTCMRLGLSRSRYLAQLAEADLTGGIGPGAHPSVRQALERLDALLGERAG